jgi:hypothetical protein
MLGFMKFFKAISFAGAFAGALAVALPAGVYFFAAESFAAGDHAALSEGDLLRLYSTQRLVRHGPFRYGCVVLEERLMEHNGKKYLIVRACLPEDKIQAVRDSLATPPAIVGPNVLNVRCTVAVVNEWDSSVVIAFDVPEHIESIHLIDLLKSQAGQCTPGSNMLLSEQQTNSLCTQLIDLYDLLGASGDTPLHSINFDPWNLLVFQASDGTVQLGFLAALASSLPQLGSSDIDIKDPPLYRAPEALLLGNWEALWQQPADMFSLALEIFDLKTKNGYGVSCLGYYQYDKMVREGDLFQIMQTDAPSIAQYFAPNPDARLKNTDELRRFVDPQWVAPQRKTTWTSWFWKFLGW